MPAIFTSAGVSYCGRGRHIHTLVERRVDLAGPIGQPGAVQIGEVDEGRTLQRGAAVRLR